MRRFLASVAKRVKWARMSSSIGRAQQRSDRRLNVAQPAAQRGRIQPPRSPQFDGHVDAAIAQLLAFGGDAEDVGDKEFGDKAFVVVVDLLRGIHPTDGLAHRRLGLDQHQGDAVDQQDQVGAAFSGPGTEGVLGGDDVLVAVEIVEVDQADGDMLVAFAKGHGAVTAQPGGELLVGLDQTVAAHGEHDARAAYRALRRRVRAGRRWWG